MVDTYFGYNMDKTAIKFFTISTYTTAAKTAMKSYIAYRLIHSAKRS